MDLGGGFNWGQGGDGELDRDEVVQRCRETMEQGREWMGKLGRAWQGDTHNDQLARELVAVGTMLIGALSDSIEQAQDDPKSVNPMILALAIKAYEAHMNTLSMLYAVGSLAGKIQKEDDPDVD